MVVPIRRTDLKDPLRLARAVSKRGRSQPPRRPPRARRRILRCRVNQKNPRMSKEPRTLAFASSSSPARSSTMVVRITAVRLPHGRVAQRAQHRHEAGFLRRRKHGQSTNADTAKLIDVDYVTVYAEFPTGTVEVAMVNPRRGRRTFRRPQTANGRTGSCLFQGSGPADPTKGAARAGHTSRRGTKTPDRSRLAYIRHPAVDWA